MRSFLVSVFLVGSVVAIVIPVRCRIAHFFSPLSLITYYLA